MQRKVMHTYAAIFNLYQKFVDITPRIEFLFLRDFRFRRLWRYIIMVSFVIIVFEIVKLKVFKVLRTDSASIKWPFCEVLDPYSAKYGPILPKFSP